MREAIAAPRGRHRRADPSCCRSRRSRQPTRSWSTTIVPALFSRAFAVALSRASALAGATTGFHLKIDSGMNRIGVRAEDAPDFLESLAGLPGLALGGVFTHFATADVPGDWEFERQLERFTAAVDADARARHRSGRRSRREQPRHDPASGDPLRHGALRRRDLRPASRRRRPTTAIDLEPAMAVKARVSRVARLAMGEGVSYGFTWHAAAPATIATLPLGYADGVRRALSGEMRVLLGGRECRQVGRICMDQLMVEVPRGLRRRRRATRRSSSDGQGRAAITMERTGGTRGDHRLRDRMRVRRSPGARLHGDIDRCPTRHPDTRAVGRLAASRPSRTRPRSQPIGPDSRQPCRNVHGRVEDNTRRQPSRGLVTGTLDAGGRARPGVM